MSAMTNSGTYLLPLVMLSLTVFMLNKGNKMNALAYKEFTKFLQSHTEDRNKSRIGFDLGRYAYIELMHWMHPDTERTFNLDNEAQLLLVLLILEASK